MNEINIIHGQIRHMRKARVEPYAVIMSDEVYSKLNEPKSIDGIPVELDGGMNGWAVR